MIEKGKEKIIHLWSLFGKFFKQFYSIIKRPEMRVLPGNLAFFLVLSFAPILTLIALLASRFSIPLLSFIQDFKNVIPNDIFQVFYIFFNEANPPTHFVVIYLLVGFLLASNGAHSIIIASNTLYGIKQGSFLKRRIKAFFLTLILILQFLFILLFLVFGNILVKWVLDFAIFESIRSFVFESFTFLKWPLMIMISYLLIKLLYTFAPDTKVSSKQVTRGTIFTTLGWTFVTGIYAYYANNLANYSVFYGSLSNLIVLMIWIYIVSYLLVLGIAINVSHYGVGKKEE